MYDSMNRWLVCSRVTLFGSIRLMLGRNSSADRSFSGSYIGQVDDRVGHRLDERRRGGVTRSSLIRGGMKMPRDHPPRNGARRPDRLERRRRPWRRGRAAPRSAALPGGVADLATLERVPDRLLEAAASTLSTPSRAGNEAGAGLGDHKVRGARESIDGLGRLVVVRAAPTPSTARRHRAEQPVEEHADGNQQGGRRRPRPETAATAAAPPARTRRGARGVAGARNRLSQPRARPEARPWEGMLGELVRSSRRPAAPPSAVRRCTSPAFTRSISWPGVVAGSNGSERIKRPRGRTIRRSAADVIVGWTRLWP